MKVAHVYCCLDIRVTRCVSEKIAPPHFDFKIHNFICEKVATKIKAAGAIFKKTSQSKPKMRKFAKSGWTTLPQVGASRCHFCRLILNLMSKTEGANRVCYQTCQRLVKFDHMSNLSSDNLQANT
jgi:hypothetical protein